MRTFDKLVRTCQDFQPDVRRLALHQMETIPLDFEADDYFSFLQHLATREKPVVAAQARRTYRRLLPQYTALRYRLRQPTSTVKAGTWTEYNIDRAEVDKLKRLGLAQTQDFTSIEMDQFLRSGLHLLSAPVQHLIDRFRSLPEALLPDAIACMGNLATAEAVHVLADVGTRFPALSRTVAGALADAKTDVSFRALSQMFQAATDQELAADLALELKVFPAQDARELLLSRLNGEPALRAGIAGALGSYAQGSLPHLTRLLHDPDPGVVMWALDSAGRTPDPALIPELERCSLQTGSPWVSRLAVKAAAATRDKRALDLLDRALTSEDPGVRALAIEGLVMLHIPEKELFDRVFRLLQDPDPEVVGHAVLAVAPMDSGPAMQRIKTMLASQDPIARQQGYWCLGYVQSRPSITLVQQAVYQEQDDRVVVSAVKSLAKYESSESTELLLSLFKHPNKLVRLQAARILGEATDRDVGKKVIPRMSQVFTSEPDARVRAALLRSISYLGDPGQYLLLSRGLKDQAEEVVQAGIEGLDVLGNIDSIPLIEPFLADARPGIRAQACLALWNQGELRVVRKLAETLEGSDEASLRAAIRSLSEILASLRRLEDSSKYVLLFSELKTNLKSAEFLAFESTIGDVRVAQRSSGRVEAFEFRTVVAKDTDSSGGTSMGNSQPGRIPIPPAPAPATVSGQTPVQASVPAPAPPAERPVQRDTNPRQIRPSLDSSSGRSRPVDSLPPNRFSRTDPPSSPDPMLDAAAAAAMAANSAENRLAFLTATQIGRLEDPSEVTERPIPEIELEQILQRIRRGEGRSLLGRLGEIARERSDAAAHLLAAQVLLEQAHGNNSQAEDFRLRALEELERAQKLSPDHVEPSLRLLELQRDRDRAQVYRQFHNATRIALRCLKLQVDMVGQFLDANQVDEAATVVAQLNRQLPRLAETNAIHGEVLYRRGDYVGAFNQLHLAHLVDPTNHALTYMLARAAFHCGKESFARQLLLSLLDARDVDPDLSEKVRQVLKKL